MATRKFLYIGTDGFETESSGAYETSDFLNTSAGASDAGKPIVLDADGNIDATMINDADIDHGNLTNTHNLTTDIDHDTLTNTHNLTTDIDHDQLTNFTSDEHFTQANITQTGTVTSGTWASTVTVDTISELTPANGVAIDGVTLKDGDVVISAGNLLSLNGETILSESGGDNTLSNINAIDATTETTLEAAIDSLVNLTAVGTIGTGTWQGDAVGVAYGGTGATTVLGAQQNLDLEVGVDVQAYDAELAAIAGLTSAANKIPYFTGSGTASMFDFIDDDTFATATSSSLASAESIKAYVDAVASGLAVHDPVRVATTGALEVSWATGVTYSNGTGGVGATLTEDDATDGSINSPGIDGITDLIVGDRVLVKNQTPSYENGIYEVTTVGNGTDTPWVLTRTADFDNSPGEEIHDGDFFFVGEGSTLAHTSFVQTAVDPITVGTDAITFSQYSAAESITAGVGLYKSGNDIKLSLDEMSTGAISNADYLIFTDGVAAPNASNEKITVTNFVEAIDGDGIVANSGVLDLSLDNISGTNAVDVTADSIAILDATDSSTNKETIADLATAMAGNGIKATTGVFSVDFNEISTDTIDEAADSIMFMDATDASSKKTTIPAFISAIAGTGLNDIGGDGTMDLDLNGLSAPSGGLDVSADFFAIGDTSASSLPRKVTLTEYATAIAGSGLTATSGVLSVDAHSINTLTDVDTTGVADGHILIYDGVTDNRYESKAVSGDVTISASGVTTIGSAVVDDSMINWGTGAGQVSATDIPIATDAYFTVDTLQGVTDELSAQIGGDTSTTFNFTEANVLTDNDAVYSALEKLDLKWGDLASTANNEGASLVGVEDSSGYFSGSDVEAILAELYGLATAGSAVTYTAGTGGVAKGDLVYVSANNTCLPYDTISASETVIGVAQAAATVGNPVTVLADDNIVASLFVALTNIAALPSAGDSIYWWGDGGTYDFTTALTDFSGGDYIWKCGVAKNTTDLHVDVKFIKKATA